MSVGASAHSEASVGVRATHAASGRLERIGVAGDWHGNRAWAAASIRTLARARVREIYHLGDLGIWPGRAGRENLRTVDEALASHELTMFVTPGNHEDYDQINALDVVDRGHDIGEIQWLTDRIAVLPRGHRWQRNGWSFVSLGGAPSVDRAWRQDGISWWAAEAITREDVDRVVAGGGADIMLAHDAPDTGLGTPGVAQVLRSNPFGFPANALTYAAEGRHLMTEAFLAVQPRLFMHGHYHLSDETRIKHFEHPTHVVSLDCDGRPDWNLALVTLPDRGDIRRNEPSDDGPHHDESHQDESHHDGPGQRSRVAPLVEFLRVTAPK